MNENLEKIAELLETRKIRILLIGMYDAQPETTCFKVEYGKMLLHANVTTELIKNDWVAAYEQIVQAVEERETYYANIDRDNERQRGAYKQPHRRF